jgi:hypothetical protein
MEKENKEDIWEAIIRYSAKFRIAYIALNLNLETWNLTPT